MSLHGVVQDRYLRRIGKAGEHGSFSIQDLQPERAPVTVKWSGYWLRGGRSFVKHCKSLLEADKFIRGKCMQYMYAPLAFDIFIEREPLVGRADINMFWNVD